MTSIIKALGLIKDIFGLVTKAWEKYKEMKQDKLNRELEEALDKSQEAKNLDDIKKAAKDLNNNLNGK